MRLRYGSKLIVRVHERFGISLNSARFLRHMFGTPTQKRPPAALPSSSAAFREMYCNLSNAVRVHALRLIALIIVLGRLYAYT